MQLKSTHELSETKKDIARILTAINAKKGEWWLISEKYKVR
jgi:ribosomal protein L29